MIHIDAAQGCNTRINAVTTGAVHNGHTPPIEAKTIDHTTTHYINLITEHPHIEII